VFVESLEGCYTNVVGLPLARLGEMLKQSGYDIYKQWSAAI
ncbi:MAG: Maf-like protein, partial [Pelotomaculum thermopropionicum]